ncbi:hypothetical protein ACNKHM_08480 [Shigella sonnei]
MLLQIAAKGNRWLLIRGCDIHRNGSPNEFTYMSPKIITVQPVVGKTLRRRLTFSGGIGIGLMLVLNFSFKINSMVALLVAALSVGMLAAWI